MHPILTPEELAALLDPRAHVETAPPAPRPTRRFCRVVRRARVDVLIEGRHYAAVLEDISLGGARVRLNMPLCKPPDAPVHLRLRGAEVRLALRAGARWVRAVKGAVEMGLRFEDLQPEDVGELARYLDADPAVEPPAHPAQTTPPGAGRRRDVLRDSG